MSTKLDRVFPEGQINPDSQLAVVKPDSLQNTSTFPNHTTEQGNGKNQIAEEQKLLNPVLEGNPPGLIVKTIDVPIPKKAAYSRMFFADLTPTQLAQINDSYFELFEVRGQTFGRLRGYQIINNNDKIQRTRQGIVNGFELVRQQQLLKKLSPLLGSLYNEIIKTINSCPDLFKSEVQFFQNVPYMKSYHQKQLEAYKNHIEELKKELNKYRGDEQENILRKKITWAKMQTTLHQTAIEIHIPVIERTLKMYTEEKNGVIEMIIENKNPELEDFKAKGEKWVQISSEIINRNEVCLNGISNLSGEVLQNSSRHLEEGLNIFQSGVKIFLTVNDHKIEFGFIRKFISLLDEINAIQAARVPYADQREDLKKWNESNINNMKTWKNAYNTALVNEKMVLISQINQTQIKILESNIQKLFAISRQLQAQQTFLQSRLDLVEKDIGSLNPVAQLGGAFKTFRTLTSLGSNIVGVIHGDMSQILPLVTNAFKIAVPLVKNIRKFFKTRNSQTENMDEEKINEEIEKIDNLDPSEAIPNDAMQFINEAESKNLQNDAQRLIDEMNTMVGENKEESKRNYEIWKAKAAESQEFINMLEDLNKNLQVLSQLRDDPNYFKKVFQIDKENFKKYLWETKNREIVFYSRSKSVNIVDLQIPFNQFLILLGPFMNIKDPSCLCGCAACTKSAQKSFETSSLTINQIKRKLCKIIRKRERIPKNDIFVSYEQRLMSLRFIDILEFYQSKKLWAILRNCCQTMQFSIYQGFDQNSGNPKGLSAKKLNVNFRMDSIFRILVSNMAGRVDPATL